jgi:Cu-Zn family superoxide dismutase
VRFFGCGASVMADTLSQSRANRGVAMRRMRGKSSLSVLGIIALVVLAIAPGSASGSADGSVATATLRDANGAVVGRVALAPAGETVLVAVRANGLPAGFHGFHIHAVGLCEPPFTTAGGHHNPAGGNHGDHAGDLPVLLVQSSGGASAAVQTDRFTIDSLFDTDGSAVIVHAAADNYANVPSRYVSSTTGLPGPDAATLATGDSGGRTACGVLTR